MGFDKPNTRKCVELIYQQQGAERWSEIEGLLTDLIFLQAKIKTGLVTEVLDDYQKIPDVLSESHAEALKQFKRYYKFYSLCCRKVQVRNYSFIRKTKAIF